MVRAKNTVVLVKCSAKLKIKAVHLLKTKMIDDCFRNRQGIWLKAWECGGIALRNFPPRGVPEG